MRSRSLILAAILTIGIAEVIRSGAINGARSWVKSKAGQTFSKPVQTTPAAQGQSGLGPQGQAGGGQGGGSVGGW